MNRVGRKLIACTTRRAADGSDPMAALTSANLSETWSYLMSDDDQRFPREKPPPLPNLTLWQRIQKWVRPVSSFVTVEVIRAAIATVTTLAIAYGSAALWANDTTKHNSESEAITK